jgi:dimethylhistidine N-methyltransferase
MASPKFLSSKYFYDARGDKLFQQIMDMPEYYLTNCEVDIFNRYKNPICKLFEGNGDPFSLIELGAGDGKKTKILMHQLLADNAEFIYRPIDISQSALDELQNSIFREMPAVQVVAMQGTYFESLREFQDDNMNRKVILFLGSNIGNLLHGQAREFLGQLQSQMSKGDMLFVGFDQKKNPREILDAYNDPTGITEAFNKNVLLRINRELGGSFDPDNFMHWEVYDPETGTAKSYLVAREAHSVRVEALKLEVHFDAWETIHTEISQKYDHKTVEWLAGNAGLVIMDTFSDPEGRYTDYLFRKK